MENPRDGRGGGGSEGRRIGGSESAIGGLIKVGSLVSKAKVTKL